MDDKPHRSFKAVDPDIRVYLRFVLPWPSGDWFWLVRIGSGWCGLVLVGADWFWVALYFRPDVLNEDVTWLRGEGYQIDEFECTRWHAESDFHADVAERLAFPDYYGRNLDAFNDCIGDIEVPSSGGRAIVFRRFDLFTEREPRVAQFILDIMASASWHCLLFGRRLLTLVQSDDPRIAFEAVGAHPAVWNPREWLNKNR